MRRLLHIIRNLARSVSFALFVTTALFWKLSYPWGDEPLYVSTPSGGLVVSSFHGDVGITIYTYVNPQSDHGTSVSTNWDELDDYSSSIRRTAQVLVIGFADEVIRSRLG